MNRCIQSDIVNSNTINIIIKHHTQLWPIVLWLGVSIYYFCMLLKRNLLVPRNTNTKLKQYIKLRLPKHEATICNKNWLISWLWYHILWYCTAMVSYFVMVTFFQSFAVNKGPSVTFCWLFGPLTRPIFSIMELN